MKELFESPVANLLNNLNTSAISSSNPETDNPGEDFGGDED